MALELVVKGPKKSEVSSTLLPGAEPLYANVHIYIYGIFVSNYN